MMYMDPLPITCEHCQHKHSYPIETLKSYKALCEGCGQLLKQAPNEMHTNSRKHRAEMWPAFFMMDLIEEYDIDMDTICEESLERAFEGDSQIKEVIKMINDVAHKDISNDILTMDSITPILTHLESANIFEYSLRELAQIAHPPFKPR